METSLWQDNIWSRTLPTRPYMGHCTSTLKYTQSTVSMYRTNVIWIQAVLRIRDVFSIQEPKGQKDSGSRIQIRIKEFKYF
jgi:hypothetical protein